MTAYPKEKKQYRYGDPQRRRRESNLLNNKSQFLHYVWFQNVYVPHRCATFILLHKWDASFQYAKFDKLNYRVLHISYFVQTHNQTLMPITRDKLIVPHQMKQYQNHLAHTISHITSLPQQYHPNVKIY